MSITVDTRGKLCPLPLILFRQALKENPEERFFEVITDNAIACSNLNDFIRDHHFTVTEHTEGDTTTLSVEVPQSSISAVPTNESKSIGPTQAPMPGDTVVILKSNKMGIGNEELGGMLIKSYLTALAEVTPLPTKIICYNEGALLVVNESPALRALQKLQELGVKVLVCGLCADYLGIKDKIGVGQISNMMTIAETLQSASKIIYP